MDTVSENLKAIKDRLKEIANLLKPHFASAPGR